MIVALSASPSSVRADDFDGYGALPPKVAVWANVEFQGAPLARAYYRSEALPYSGQELHKLKAIRVADKTPVAAVFDQAGKPQADGGEALRTAEKKARYQLYGAVRPRLVDALAALKDSDLVDVVIWLHTVEPVADKEDLLADPVLLADVEAQAAAIHEQARNKLMADWALLTKAFIQFDVRHPVAYATLSKAEIWAIGKHPAVARLYLDSPPVPVGTSWYQTDCSTGTGVDGTGVEVCVLELDRPSSTSCIPGIPGTSGIRCAAPNGCTGGHAQMVTEIVRASGSPPGVATGAATSIANFATGCGCSGYASAAHNWCSQTRAADVWNYSNTCPDQIPDMQDWNVKRSPFPLIADGAGNDGVNVESGCTGFNILNVGGSDDQADSTRSNDAIYGATSSKNPAGTDRELPHLCAPAESIETDCAGTWSGTSAAAPQVSGGAAQVIDKNGGLDGWPEAVRSILQCGADEDVNGVRLDLDDATDDRDGAGELNIGMSISIADSANRVDSGNTARATGFDYGTAHINDFNGYWFNRVYNAKTTESGKKIRVVLSWDGTASCTDPDDSSTCTSSVIDVDLDLSVWDPVEQNFIANSITFDSSFEFVEFSAVADRTYTIKINHSGWTPGVSQTYFGIAWNTDGYSS